MSEWKNTDAIQPEERETVIGYYPDLHPDMSLTYWFKHNSGEIMWCYMQSTGGPNRAKNRPTFWHYMPAKP